MAARPLLYYLPIIPIGCLICIIIGAGVWVHYTVEALNQVDYALQVLGPAVTAENLGRGVEAVEGTSSSYLIFACALFGLGLYRRLLSIEHDVSGAAGKSLQIYRIANAVVHFIWWLIMVWIVVLMMGLAVLSILTWVGYRAVGQVLDNQTAVKPNYDRWLADNAAGLTGPIIGADQLAVAGNDTALAVMMRYGWPAARTCPSTCVNLMLFQFLAVDEAQACVCDRGVLTLVQQAARAALDAVPGIMVGIWFMYVFGDFLKTSLACDFTNASRDGEGGMAPVGAGPRGGQSAGRGYYKL